ncbi:MAG: hypothetical protein QOD86_2776 [Miltoncostaeaceae bacterium]|nr:hypothetical protein [Miltoncostaeaceae bacterium]
MAWILLAYRLPSEPSTPRITLWRRLRRLGALQIVDGLVALPESSRAREQLEWLADEVLEAGGEATIWLSQTTAPSHDRALAERMAQAVAEEYRGVTRAARDALEQGEGSVRRLRRLRRELQRIRARDHFPPPERAEAEEAVARLVQLMAAAP